MAQRTVLRRPRQCSPTTTRGGIKCVSRAMPSGLTFAETPNAHVAEQRRLPKKHSCPRGVGTHYRLQTSNRLASLFNMGIILPRNGNHLSEVVAMARTATQRGALSLGQSACRWGLGADRVRRLVAGLLEHVIRMYFRSVSGARLPRLHTWQRDNSRETCQLPSYCSQSLHGVIPPWPSQLRSTNS